jgi:hypothetical protein
MFKPKSIVTMHRVLKKIGRNETNVVQQMQVILLIIDVIERSNMQSVNKEIQRH